MLVLLSLVCIKITPGNHIVNALTVLLLIMLALIEKRPQRVLLPSDFRQTSNICISVILFLLRGVYQPVFDLTWWNVFLTCIVLLFSLSVSNVFTMLKLKTGDELGTIKKINYIKNDRMVYASRIKPYRKLIKQTVSRGSFTPAVFMY